MVVKQSYIKVLEEIYNKSGNQLVVLYGRMGCGKETLLMDFLKQKKFFYYRCRQASADEQRKMMGEEIARTFDVKLLKNTYDEYFNRIKSGDPSKLVVVIDEAQFAMKKDEELLSSLIKLKNKKLYPGPIMIVVVSSSIVWAEQDREATFKEDIKKVDEFIKIDDMNFLEVVRTFPSLPVRDSIMIYGVLGGVPEYLDKWDVNSTFKNNICNLIIDKNGPLHDEAQYVISQELRELSVYNTILATIARGQNKLNDLFHETGFSRAKISVYMKNLNHFDIVEKLVSFETGGWDNAKKGVYQIKDTFVNFWFKFIYPHLSDLYLMSNEQFYDTYIADEINEYLERYFRNVCMEYLMLLNQMGQLPFAIYKVGTWVGKTGSIDIIAQSEDRQNVIGFCNWNNPQMTMEMCEQMATAMEKAKLESDNYYLFSATEFEPDLEHYVTMDPRFRLINMNEL